MDDIFLLREGIDYTKLKLTEEGSYSVTRRRDADRIMNVIRKVVGDLSSKSITDATGCMGGDTIHFGFHFKEVYSIELSNDNFHALTNNVQVYGLKNVKLYQGDATQVLNWKTDVLYIDPPWGGPQYRDKKDLDLYMSSKRIDQWLEDILLRRNRPSYIFLKLPNNYNFNRFNFLSNVNLIKPFRIRSYVLVCIEVHQPNPSKNPPNL